MYITGVIITIHMHIYIFYVSSAANSECNNKLASFHFVSAAVVPSVNFAGFIGPDQIYVICRNYSSNFSFSTLQHTHAANSPIPNHSTYSTNFNSMPWFS